MSGRYTIAIRLQREAWRPLLQALWEVIRYGETRLTVSSLTPEILHAVVPAGVVMVSESVKRRGLLH